MLSRNEKGKLALKSLDFQILISDMFTECKDQREIEWLGEALSGIVECSAEERLDEIEIEEEEC